MIVEVVSTQELISIMTSPVFIILEIIGFVFIVFGINLLFRDYTLKKLKEDNNLLVIDITGRNSEFVENENMSTEEMLKYFKDNYNFDIGDDSILILNKAQDYLKRLKDHYVEAKLTLYSMELGLYDKTKTIHKMNECGGFMLMSSHELKIMFELFSHLYEQDQSYHDELWVINSIRNEYSRVEKKLINICLTMISESGHT